MKKGNVSLSPVFQTKEQEQLFAQCAKESMFKYMADEEPLETGYQKILK